MMTKEQIEQRITELVNARDQFHQKAERELLGFNVRIDELQRLLADPKEENVTEFPKPKEDPAAQA